MPVSSGLQKYFDSQRSKKGNMQQKFAALADQIDPAFMQSLKHFMIELLE